jgi:hypothetical protein
MPNPFGMEPTDEEPCNSEEEAKPPPLAEFRQMLEDYARDLREIINKLRRKLS